MALLCRNNMLKALTNKNTTIAASMPVINQKRGIYGKEMRNILKIGPRKKPFPFHEKYLYLWRTWLDRTWEKFDANSKVICVEGPIAAGKTALAKQIAEEFDLKHFPEPNMDMIYINRYGFDLRKCDPELPDTCKSYDHVNFCKDPCHPTSSSFQIIMYTLRYGQYIDALAHLFNSGQGVVIERSPFSDFAFIEAMAHCNFISNAAKSVYKDVRQNTIEELLKPHLVIYLDVPVDTIQQRVKERNYPHEVNSKVMSTEYLSMMEKMYKTRYLKDISKSSQLLVYDWTGWGDTEIVFEDIERVDLDTYELHEPRFEEWQFENEQDISGVRRKYTIYKGQLMSLTNVPRYDVPEMIIPADDLMAYDLVMERAPGGRYAYGFNKECGDRGLLFKTKKPYRGIINEEQ